jgi:hypothetical protein
MLGVVPTPRVFDGFDGRESGGEPVVLLAFGRHLTSSSSSRS